MFRLAVILPLLPLMTPLGNVAVTFVISLPSPIICPNEPVDVAEPLIAKLPSLGTSNRVLVPAWSLLYSSSRINLLAAVSNLKLTPL